MSHSCIKLHRKHMPIHPKKHIRNQKDYDIYTAMLLYLEEQLSLGVAPKYMVTIHYQHPVEHTKPIRETDKPYGFRDRYGINTKRSIWNEVPMYNYWESKRNDWQQVVIDTKKIKCRILKRLYGIKRLNRTDKYDFPNLLFFHERGKTKLQFHTHILMPSNNLITDSIDELTNIFNTTIRAETKSISRWKHIDVEKVDTPKGAISYLNKETNSSSVAFDFDNSIPIVPSNNNV